MNKNFGLDNSQLNFIQKTLQSILKSKEKASVFVFGSRSIGKERLYSDIDLWIDAKPELSLHEKTEIEIFFKESDLSIKVDIVTPQTCLDDYRLSIEKQKKLWFKLGS